MTNKRAIEIIEHIIGCNNTPEEECMDNECITCKYHYTQKEQMEALEYTLSILMKVIEDAIVED